MKENEVQLIDALKKNREEEGLLQLKAIIRETILEMQQQDSIEIGNSKSGILKVYFNALKTEEAEQKIKNAKELLLKHRKEILENGG